MIDIANLDKKKRDSMLFILDLYKSYGDNLVLDNLDLTVRKGTLCTLVGPSGCGKSTLLRLILGQEKPTQGEILIEGQEVGHPHTDRGIVYQKYSLFPHLTVLENVTLGKKLTMSFWQWQSRKKEILDLARQMLKRVRLEGNENKFPHELSGGMQQRVAIAQSLIMRPKILLMDEPFGALDPGTREDMQLFLIELWKETQTTIFFITPDLEEAVYLGTSLLLLSQFYTDGRGDEIKRGAKIVADYDLTRFSHKTTSKKSAEFGSFIQEVRHAGFDPAYKRHAEDFNLSHEDSFHTLTEEEMEDLKE